MTHHAKLPQETIQDHAQEAQLPAVAESRAISAAPAETEAAAFHGRNTTLKLITAIAAAILASNAILATCTARADTQPGIPALFQLVVVTVTPPNSLAACLEARGAALRRKTTLSAACVQRNQTPAGAP